MKYEEKIDHMRAGHRMLSERLGSNAVWQLPENVDKQKLESAYDKIENEYEWVLKRKER